MGGPAASGSNQIRTLGWPGSPCAARDQPTQPPGAFGPPGNSTPLAAAVGLRTRSSEGKSGHYRSGSALGTWEVTPAYHRCDVAQCLPEAPSCLRPEGSLPCPAPLVRAAGRGARATHQLETPPGITPRAIASGRPPAARLPRRRLPRPTLPTPSSTAAECPAWTEGGAMTDRGSFSRRSPPQRPRQQASPGTYELNA